MDEHALIGACHPAQVTKQEFEKLSHAMQKAEEERNRLARRESAILSLQEMFRRDKKLKPLVRHVRGGFALLDFYLGVLDFADKSIPKGFEYELVLSNKTLTAKTESELKVLDWIFNVAVKSAMQADSAFMASLKKRKK